MKISVIIPVYNGATTIVAAIQSVLQQTHPVHELIIVDDGSSDNTSAIISGNFEKECLSGKIKLVSQQNSGPSAARNNGAQLATGTWLSFLDADDVWAASKLEEQVAFLKKYDDIVLCGTLTTLNASPGDASPSFPGRRSMLFKNYFATSSVLITKRIFYKAGGFNEKQKYSEDYNLWLRVVTAGNKAGLINKILVNYSNEQKSERLSRNAIAMLAGELGNWAELYRKKQISYAEYLLATLVSRAKHIRRRLNDK